MMLEGWIAAGLLLALFIFYVVATSYAIHVHRERAKRWMLRAKQERARANEADSFTDSWRWAE